MVVTVCLSIENCHCTRLYRDNWGHTKVPTDIPTDVTDLYLRYNEITSLHDCEFCSYIQLQSLHLDGNKISQISSSAFSNTVLKILYLSDNQLTAMPDLEIIKETICRLDLSNNQITDLDAEVCFEHMTYLDLGENQIKFISSSAFDNCIALEKLLLKSNQLTTLSKVPLDKLQQISVTGNPLVCDSRLLWLKAVEENGVQMEDFECAGPDCLQGRSFSNVTREELLSSGKLQPAHHVTSFVVIYMKVYTDITKLTLLL